MLFRRDRVDRARPVAGSRMAPRLGHRFRRPCPNVGRRRPQALTGYGRTGRPVLFGQGVDDMDPISTLTFGTESAPLSVLDPAPVPDGGHAADGLRATIALGR